MGEWQDATAHVGSFQICAEQIRVRQPDAVQKCATHVYSNQWHMIGVEFVEGLHASAAAALALSRVDDLPSLVVLLLLAVARFGEIENDGN
jgi:hypothetical protein